MRVTLTMVPRVNKQAVFVNKLNYFPDKDIWIFLISFLVFHVRSDASLHAFHAKTLLTISHTCQVPNPSLTPHTLISDFTKKTQEDQSCFSWVPSRPFPFTSEVFSLFSYSLIFFLHFWERNVSCHLFDFITVLCLFLPAYSYLLFCVHFLYFHL